MPRQERSLVKEIHHKLCRACSWFVSVADSSSTGGYRPGSVPAAVCQNGAECLQGSCVAVAEVDVLVAARMNQTSL